MGPQRLQQVLTLLIWVSAGLKLSVGCVMPATKQVCGTSLKLNCMSRTVAAQCSATTASMSHGPRFAAAGVSGCTCVQVQLRPMSGAGQCLPAVSHVNQSTRGQQLDCCTHPFFSLCASHTAHKPQRSSAAWPSRTSASTLHCSPWLPFTHTRPTTLLAPFPHNLHHVCGPKSSPCVTPLQ
jgi:hypothetical protein